MRILTLRFIVTLSVVYLCLVLMLYRYLRKTHSLERGLSLLDLRDSSPHDNDVLYFSGDTVEFNFKRRNGFLEETNETVNNNRDISSELRSNVSLFVNSSHVLLTKTQFSIFNLLPPSNCIHAFYYMWYGNPKLDGKYYHWNHRYLPHWEKKVSRRYPLGRHVPPDDIGTSFYPQLGCYSSRDPSVVEAHMYQLRQAGVGVISASWYPREKADEEGFPPDPLLPLLLDIAQLYSIKVTIHIEPYEGRSPYTVRNDLAYIMENYYTHPAFYKHEHRVPYTQARKRLPLVYIYDSYLSKASEWREILQPGRTNSIRGTSIDCLVIGLLVNAEHKNFIVEGRFDGFYTYFASRSFSFGSNFAHWGELGKFSKKNNLIFIPSFGPGYDDVRVRPWNEVNSKSRQDGEYYREMFEVAMKSSVSRGEEGTEIVSLTSFNEWHEGTQIESAIPKTTDAGYTYTDYSPHGPDFYLRLTREISNHKKIRCKL